ncbi:MAG: transcription termination/antitermination protein NusA [Spirochaetales bacterium]|nr:transcription termination/antitermination protein NusA [Spirochaetales bacterium]
MASGLADAIKALVQDRGISEELVKQTIEDFLFAAYKRKFGTTENAVVKFNDDDTEVSIYARKNIVAEVEDSVFEIPLKEALLENEESEIGDELLIYIDPSGFDRGAVQSAKQNAKQTLREINKDTLYSEYKGKEGEMIIGYHQRERNGNIFVDLGKVEGILPKRFQSPRETYRPNDRIKALIYEVNKTPTGLQVILSRTHTDFVRRIFELEVPEIYDNTVEIFKIVREPGYRTKISVYSNREDVDPVGACVGIKGVRIQSVVREMEGEKIDILKYVTDPKEFIKNALSPAEVENVIILNESKRQALAIVNDSQLSLAIGKRGLNVRLANRLVDWNIDVKNHEQFEEMDITLESKKELDALFNDTHEDMDEITSISELPGMPERLAELLAENGINLIESLVSLEKEDLSKLEGITAGNIETIRKIIAESIDIVEEADNVTFEDDQINEDYSEDAEEEEVVEEYECPECSNPVTADMEVCPECGVGLSFEIEEVEEDE